VFGIIEKCFIGAPAVKRIAVGAIREFQDVRQRRLVLDTGFNARGERFVFDWTQNAQERHDCALRWADEEGKLTKCSAREQHQPASQMPLSDRQFTFARNAQQFTE
jgi:hypothetical protein